MKKKLDWIKEWINKADKDLKVAERFLNDENMADVVCFRAQQASEKCLKAYLNWLEIEYPKTHLLEKLIELASLTDKDISKLKEDAAKLSPFAVETRYPEFELPLSEDALEALEISYKIRNYVLSKLPRTKKEKNDV